MRSTKECKKGVFEAECAKQERETESVKVRGEGA